MSFAAAYARDEVLLDQVREREPRRTPPSAVSLPVDGSARLLVEAGQESEDVLLMGELRVGDVGRAQRGRGRLGAAARGEHDRDSDASATSRTERRRVRGVTNRESNRESANADESLRPAGAGLESAERGHARQPDGLEEPPLHRADEVDAEHPLGHEVQRLLRLVVRGAVDAARSGRRRARRRARPGGCRTCSRNVVISSTPSAAARHAERRDREQRLDLGPAARRSGRPSRRGRARATSWSPAVEIRR